LFAIAFVASLALGLAVLARPGPPEAPRTTVPYVIPYQGVLERNGQLVNAIGGDTVGFRVSLWDAHTGGVRVWPEADQGFEYEEYSVNVYNGRFAFHVGSVVEYRHIADTDLYLDIQVKGPADPDFVPLGGRQRFLSSPYAVAAERADTDFSVPGRLTVDGPTGLEDMVTVNGDMQTNSLLNILGDLQVDGLQPFMWRQYLSSQPALEVDTGMSTSDWWAVIAGFDAWNGDILEDGAVARIIVCRMVQGGSGTWLIQQDFASHNTHEKWTVDVLFIRKRLVDVQ